MGFNGFDWLFLGAIGLDWVVLGFDSVLLGFTGFSLGLIRFGVVMASIWCFIGFTVFDWVLVGSVVLAAVLLVFFIGFYWVFKLFCCSLLQGILKGVYWVFFYRVFLAYRAGRCTVAVGRPRWANGVSGTWSSWSAKWCCWWMKWRKKSESLYWSSSACFFFRK